MVIRPLNRPFTQAERKEVAAILADTMSKLGYKASGLRVSHVSSGNEFAVMDRLATRGENIEKKIRAQVEGQIPHHKMQDVLFMVDADSGTRLTIINAEGAGLSGAERALIERAFEKANKDVK